MISEKLVFLVELVRWTEASVKNVWTWNIVRNLLYFFNNATLVRNALNYWISSFSQKIYLYKQTRSITHFAHYLQTLSNKSTEIQYPKYKLSNFWLPILHKWYKIARNVDWLNSVEISGFFCHSDFTWNQLRCLQKFKNCHFCIFWGSEFWDEEIVGNLEGLKITKFKIQSF